MIALTSGLQLVAAGVAVEAVVRQRVPGRHIVGERVERRPDLRVVVERPEPHGDLVALGPLVAEQRRAALHAEGLHRAAVRGRPDPDQLLALEETEPLAGDAALDEADRAGMLATA